MTYSDGQLGFFNFSDSEEVIIYSSSCELPYGATAGIGYQLIQQRFIPGISSSNDTCEGLEVFNKYEGFTRRRTSVKLLGSAEHNLNPNAIRILPPRWQGRSDIIAILGYYDFHHAVIFKIYK